jgi:hypothetical protein
MYQSTEKSFRDVNYPRSSKNTGIEINEFRDVNTGIINSLDSDEIGSQFEFIPTKEYN